MDGYDMDEIDGIASQVYDLLIEQELPNKMVVLGLCRAMVRLVNANEDLDLACYAIDKFKEDEEVEDGSEVGDPVEE